MRRALPYIAATLAVACLLAAGVLAAPDPPPPSHKQPGNGPFALMGERPTEAMPRLQEFQEPEPPLAQTSNPAPPLEPIDTLAPNLPKRPSRAIGHPANGRLKNGVQFPVNGVAFFTFDSALRRSPSRGFRRWGTDVNVTRTLHVLREFRAAHPDGAAHRRRAT